LAAGAAGGDLVAAVHEVALSGPVDDLAWPGACITRALCGHWDHPGPCRWPHHNEALPTAGGVTVRTVFAAPAGDHAEVLGHIGDALAGGPWTVVRAGVVPLRTSERALAERLAGRR
jgi:hypothetical protein